VEKSESLYIVGRNVKWCSHFGKQSGSSSKYKLELLYDPPIPLLGIYPREVETHVQTKLFTLMFTAALFIIAENWKQPQCSTTG